MKILVCISNVPDTTTKITFTPDNKQFNTAGVQFVINPYDEYALTRAIELKEAQGGTVTVLNVGEADTEANIRKALAIGADDAHGRFRLAGHALAALQVYGRAAFAGDERGEMFIGVRFGVHVFAEPRGDWPPLCQYVLRFQFPAGHAPDVVQLVTAPVHEDTAAVELAADAPGRRA